MLRQKTPSDAILRARALCQGEVDTLLAVCYNPSMKIQKLYRWHCEFTIDPQHHTVPLTQVLRQHTLQYHLRRSGFIVEPLPSGRRGYTVSHSSAAAITLFMLSNPVPAGVTITTVP